MTVIRHIDIIEPNLFQKEIKAVGDLQKAIKKLIDQTKGKVKMELEFNMKAPVNTKAGQDMIRATSRETKQYEKVLNDLVAKEKQLKDIKSQLTDAEKRYASASSETRKRIMEGAQAIRQRMAEEQQEVKILGTKVGTLARLRVELSKEKAALVNNFEIGSKGWDQQVKKVQTLTDKINKAEQEMKVFGRNVGNYPAIDKLAKGWALVTAGITAAYMMAKKVYDSFSSAINKAVAMEAAENKIKMAVNGNQAAFQRMMDFTNKMSGSSLFSKTQIMEAEQMALALGKTEEQTQKMTVTAMALSRVTGQDMQTAMMQLQGTLEGTKGRLGKFAGEIKNMSEEDMRAGKAIDVLYTKIGRFATEGLNTAEGKTKLFEKAVGALKRTIGDLFIPMVTAAAVANTKLVNTINSWLKVPASEKIKDEKKEMELLVTQVTSLNEGNDTRNKLIDELVSKYPDYFGNIDKEKIKNSELLGMLGKVNEAYEKRIQLAVYGEQLAGIEKKGGENWEKMMIAQREIIKMYEQYVPAAEKVKGVNTFQMIELTKKYAPIDTRMGSGSQAGAGKMGGVVDEVGRLNELERQWYLFSGRKVTLDKEYSAVLQKQAEHKEIMSKEEQKSLSDQIAKLQANKMLTDEQKAQLEVLLAQRRASLIASGTDKKAKGITLTKDEKNAFAEQKKIDDAAKKLEQAAEKAADTLFDELKKTNQLTINQIFDAQKQALKDSGTWDKMNPEQQKKWSDATFIQIVEEQSAAEIKAFEEVQAKKKKDEEETYNFLKDLGLLTFKEIYDYEFQRMKENAAYKNATPVQRAAMLPAMSKVATSVASQSKTIISQQEIDDSETYNNPEFTPQTNTQGTLPKFDITQNFDFQDKLNKQLGYVQQFASAVSGVLGALSNKYQQDQQNELNAVEKRYGKEYDALDNMLIKKQIGEKEYNRRKLELDKKKAAEEDKIKREYARKQKEIAIIQAVINTAVGVTQALAQGGGILGVILGAIVLAAGAIEIATISGQQFEKGGHGKIDKDKGGVLQGKSHKDGGIKLPGIGEAQGGEYFAVINRGSTEKYKDTLPVVMEALNQGTFEKVVQQFINENPEMLAELFPVGRKYVNRKDINHDLITSSLKQQGAELTYQNLMQPVINVNLQDHWNKKIYEELAKPKREVSVTVVGNRIIQKEGNHTLITRA